MRDADRCRGFGPAARPRLAAKARLQPDRVSGGFVLLFPEGVLLLTPTAAAVLTLCDGRRTVDDLAVALAGSYGAAAQDVYRDTAELLARLLDRGLVEQTPEEGTGQ